MTSHSYKEFIVNITFTLKEELNVLCDILDGVVIPKEKYFFDSAAPVSTNSHINMLRVGISLQQVHAGNNNVPYEPASNNWTKIISNYPEALAANPPSFSLPNAQFSMKDQSYQSPLVSELLTPERSP